MKQTGILTLTTDFGTQDTFAGQLHGAALAIAPSLRCVDLTHAVQPGDIAAGAYALEAGARPFPSGTVHVAVVDPGVGGSRRALLAECGRHVFVGPDNGLLLRALRHDPPLRWIELDPQRVAPAGPSPTFHGRDLFVPAAAHYLCGTDAAELGRALTERDWPAIEPAATPERAFEAAERIDRPVIHCDRFGNVVVDLYLPDAIDPATGPPCVAQAGERVVENWVRTYCEIVEGPALLRNSAGYLEIACNGKSAAQLLGLVPGNRVRLIRRHC